MNISVNQSETFPTRGRSTSSEFYKDFNIDFKIKKFKCF